MGQTKTSMKSRAVLLILAVAAGVAGILLAPDMGIAPLIVGGAAALVLAAMALWP